MQDPRIEAAAKALNTAGWTCREGNDEPGSYGTCEDCTRHCDELAAAAVAAADKAATITTVEELDALPDDSIVRTAEGRTGQVYTYRNGSRMLGFTSSLHAPASLGLVRHLPAAVLHFGGTK